MSLVLLQETLDSTLATLQAALDGIAEADAALLVAQNAAPYTPNPTGDLETEVEKIATDDARRRMGVLGAQAMGAAPSHIGAGDPG